MPLTSSSLYPRNPSGTWENPSYRVIISCPDRKIEIVASLPQEISMSVGSSYEPTFAQGLSDLLPTGLGKGGKALGVSFVTQALTAQVWQGTDAIEFSIPIILQVESDPQKDILTPLGNLYSLILPSTSIQDGFFESPGPHLDLRKLIGVDSVSSVTGSPSANSSTPTSSNPTSSLPSSNPLAQAASQAASVANSASGAAKSLLDQATSAAKEGLSSLSGVASLGSLGSLASSVVGKSAVSAINSKIQSGISAATGSLSSNLSNVTNNLKGAFSSLSPLADAAGSLISDPSLSGLQNLGAAGINSASAAYSTANAAAATSGSLIRSSIKNNISLTIGNWKFFPHVVVTNVDTNTSVLPLPDGTMSKVEVTVSFRTFFVPTSNDLPNILPGYKPPGQQTASSPTPADNYVNLFANANPADYAPDNYVNTFAGENPANYTP